MELDVKSHDFESKMVFTLELTTAINFCFSYTDKISCTIITARCRFPESPFRMVIRLR